MAILVAGITVLAFMAVYYLFAGLVADLCLVLNIILVMGTMAREPVRKRSTPVSVLPDRPLDIPLVGNRPQTVSGADAILAWQQPTPKPAAAKARPASAKAKPVSGTLTARR